MSPLSPRDIQDAVVAWHNRHPIARPIDVDRVHSIGWVALPFLRPPQGVEPSMDAPTSASASVGTASPSASAGWRRWWPWPRRAPKLGSRAVFSETFIDGVSARRAAAFALRHGVSQPPMDHDNWPQRRIDVDATLAEHSVGGWPSEFWLLSAAIDIGEARSRVLVAPDGGAVLGPRQWHRGRLAAALACGMALLVAGAVLAWPDHPAPSTRPSPPPPLAASVPMEASGPASAPASAPSTPSAASAAADASSTPASEPAAAASAEADDRPASAPDIRPQLVKPLPNRRGPPPRPMLADRPDASASATDGAGRRVAPDVTAEPGAAQGAAQGAATPDQIRPGAASSGPLIALVSPSFQSQAEAEAMLVRMTEHLKVTMASQTGLKAEVMQTPEGWRAAVYPFATREEAAILNATMVARGWRTRSVTF
jgi:hypothetical protein